MNIMNVNVTDKVMEFSFADDIVKRKEMLVLNRPFIVGKNAFAVYTKHPTHGIVRVDFNSKASEDENNLGPIWESKFWSHRRSLGAIEEPNPQPLSLNQISDFYLSRTGPATWDGKIFYDHNELITKAPELKNALPSYTLTIPGKDGQKEWFPDSEPNKLAYDALKEQEVKYSKNKS